MSTMKQHRAIGIVDEDGRTMTVMAVHESIGDEVIEQLLRQYTYQIVVRMAELNIKKEQWLASAGEYGRCGKSIDEVEKMEKMTDIHIVHRINLLKKLVRMDSRMSGYVLTSQMVVDAPLFDTKGWKKKDQSALIREYRRACSTGENNVLRPVETVEEESFYQMYDRDAIGTATIMVEKVYFIDVKKGEDDTGIVKMNLYTDMEKCL